jgi:hypothetical protein
MTGYKLRGETPYYTTVKAVIAGVGVGQAFSLTEMKSEMHRHGYSKRATASLTRAMFQAELDGLVEPFYYLLPNGGRGKAFRRLPPPRQMTLDDALQAAEMPF